MRIRSFWLCFFLIGLVACSKDRKSNFLLGQPAAPSISGTWTGTLTVNGESTQIRCDLSQNNIHVTGTYQNTSGAHLGSLIGPHGQITGVTTGPSFTLQIQPENTACTLTIQAGGANSGSNLAFNVTGNDCGGTSLHGQADLLRS